MTPPFDPTDEELDRGQLAAGVHQSWIERLVARGADHGSPSPARTWNWGGRVHFAVTQVGLGTFHISGTSRAGERGAFRDTSALSSGGVDGEGALIVTWAGGHRSVLRISEFAWPLDAAAVGAADGATGAVAQGRYQALDAPGPPQSPALGAGLIRITADSGYPEGGSGTYRYRVLGVLRLLPD